MDLNFHLIIQKPAYQGLIFLLITPAIILIIRPESSDRAWLIALFPFVLFLVVNSILLWYDDRPWRYFFYSIGTAVGYLLVIAIFMAGLLKTLKLKGSGEGAMAFLILVYQPFGLLFVMLLRWIVTKS